MQTKESDIGVRRASNKKRHQNLQSIMQIPEHFEELSIRMLAALDDSGAGKKTVLERRRTYLCREHIEKIALQLQGKNMECFHFGSQSEGTTTPGLQSDIDFLMTNYEFNIMTIWEDWRAGMINLLMLHDNTTPPQQYLLQVIGVNTPEPWTSLTHDTFVRKDSGQILFSAERWKNDIAYDTRDRGEATKNGPSVSWLSNWDMVQAFHVRKPLPEIQKWIDRCRGKQWPPVQLLEAARIAPCFLVPAGHPDSDFKREEWRLSPNLIERMLIGHLQAAVRVLEDVKAGDRDLKVTKKRKLEVANRLLVETLWMDSAEVDALHHVWRTRNQLNLYHLETALNLLGHCYEMEGDYAGALDYYELSLSDERTNNAANWHILRIMRLISG
ncbi:hypothetical protein DPMN_047133 [Dreissena polymorpha]|uniref:Uncharacterized protein n=1 Tax=Dreissena polymorpha TaxID=45954 RepID=A0A9D4D961_DREPO|nr:hypothetical protein DPMN_047133 [Dreissena polymorpha]